MPNCEKPNFTGRSLNSKDMANLVRVMTGLKTSDHTPQNIAPRKVEIGAISRPDCA